MNWERGIHKWKWIVFFLAPSLAGMFLFILYNFSSGLTLYWTVQNLLSIAQMKITRAKDDPAAAATAVVKPGVKPSGPTANPPRKKK